MLKTIDFAPRPSDICEDRAIPRKSSLRLVKIYDCCLSNMSRER